MSDTSCIPLKDLLVSRYATLRRRLEYLIGSKEGAADALQETWLRLEAKGKIIPVASADAYILRMATNFAIDQYRRERHDLHIDTAEVDELFEVEDELADPERILAARRKVEALKVILRDLTPRRQEILLAARVDGQLNTEIANHLGISLRLVEKELSEALKHCNECMLEMIASGETKGRRKF